MLLYLLDAPGVARVIPHRDTERPLVYRLSTRKRSARSDILVLLEQSRDDIRLEDEPAAKVDAADLVQRVVPRLAERRRERLCASAVVVRVRGIVNPCRCKSRHRHCQHMRTRCEVWDEVRTIPAERVAVCEVGAIREGDDRPIAASRR